MPKRRTASSPSTKYFIGIQQRVFLQQPRVTQAIGNLAHWRCGKSPAAQRGGSLPMWSFDIWPHVPESVDHGRSGCVTMLLSFRIHRRSPQLIRKVARHTVLMKRLHAFGVVATAELNDPDHLFGVIDDKGVRQLLAFACMSQHIFTCATRPPIAAQPAAVATTRRRHPDRVSPASDVSVRRVPFRRKPETPPSSPARPRTVVPDENASVPGSGTRSCQSPGLHRPVPCHKRRLECGSGSRHRRLRWIRLRSARRFRRRRLLASSPFHQ
jgi:hypothetical protein